MTKRYWLSWHETGPHDYKGPWWMSGSSTQMNPVTLMFGPIRHCFAAVIANNPYEAQSIIMNAHIGHRPSSFLFCEERPESWEPFTDRFPKREGMIWPGLTQSNPDPSQELGLTASQLQSE